MESNWGCERESANEHRGELAVDPNLNSNFGQMGVFLGRSGADRRSAAIRKTPGRLVPTRCRTSRCEFSRARFGGPGNCWRRSRIRARAPINLRPRSSLSHSSGQARRPRCPSTRNYKLCAFARDLEPLERDAAKARHTEKSREGGKTVGRGRLSGAGKSHTAKREPAAKDKGAAAVGVDRKTRHAGVGGAA